jgi:hypothetical protein
MAKLVYARDLKSLGRKAMRVRPPLRAPSKSKIETITSRQASLPYDYVSVMCPRLRVSGVEFFLLPETLGPETRSARHPRKLRLSLVKANRTLVNLGAQVRQR